MFGLVVACLMVCSMSFAQEAAKTCKKSGKSCTKAEMEACAKKMGVSLEECKKICDAKAMASATEDGETRVGSAVVELPSCCYSALKADGKVCCSSHEASIASATMIVDTDGNEIKKYVCPMAAAKAEASGETKVASVVMVKELNKVDMKKTTGKKSCSKSCAKKCAGKKKNKA